VVSIGCVLTKDICNSPESSSQDHLYPPPFVSTLAFVDEIFANVKDAGPDPIQLNLASFAFTYIFLFFISIHNEGTGLGQRTWWNRVGSDTSTPDELFVDLEHSDSVVTTPAFAAFPLYAESQDPETSKKINHSFSPRTTAFPVVIESSTSSSNASSEPPTRPSTLPENPSSTNKVLPIHKYLRLECAGAA